MRLTTDIIEQWIEEVRRGASKEWTFGRTREDIAIYSKFEFLNEPDYREHPICTVHKDSGFSQKGAGCWENATAIMTAVNTYNDVANQALSLLRISEICSELMDKIAADLRQGKNVEEIAVLLKGLARQLRLS